MIGTALPGTPAVMRLGCDGTPVLWALPADMFTTALAAPGLPPPATVLAGATLGVPAMPGTIPFAAGLALEHAAAAETIRIDTEDFFIPR